MGKKGWRTFEKKELPMKELEEVVHNEEDDIRAVNPQRESDQASTCDPLVSISTPSASIPPDALKPRASFFTPPPINLSQPQVVAVGNDKDSEVERLQSRGYARRKEGDFQGAIQEYSKAIEIDQHNFRRCARDRVINFIVNIPY